MRRRHFALEFTGILILIGYVALVTTYGRASEYDEPWYKSAGREWGLRGHWAAPEITGFLPDVQPPPEEVYFCYTPLYTFGFGLLVKVLGFGWRQCVFYDATIHAVLAYLAARLTRKIGGERVPRWASWLVALAILPQGLPEGRPDELAVSFGVGGIMLLMGPRLRVGKVIGSGILYGLCAGTSMGTAAMLTSFAAVLFLMAEASWTRKILLGFAWGSIAATTLVLVVAPILIPHPGAIEQYRAITRLNVSQDWRMIPREILFGLIWRGHLVCSVVGPGLVGLFLSIRHLRNGDWGRWVYLWLGPIGAVAFWLATVPWKPAYLWFIGPWVIAVAAAELVWSWPTLSRLGRVATVLVLGLSSVVGATVTLKTVVWIAFLPTTQRQDWNRRLLADLIPPGSVVLTYDSWMLLGGDLVVYDGRFACPDLDRVDYIVLSGNGSGAPGKPTVVSVRCQPSYPFGEKFRPVAENLNRSRPTLFGKPVTRSAYGFGTLVLERISRGGDQREKSHD
jgi:hypothetical protein